VGEETSKPITCTQVEAMGREKESVTQRPHQVKSGINKVNGGVKVQVPQIQGRSRSDFWTRRGVKKNPQNTRAPTDQIEVDGERNTTG